MDGLLSRDVLYPPTCGNPRTALSASRAKLRHPVAGVIWPMRPGSSFGIGLPEDPQLFSELVEKSAGDGLADRLPMPKLEMQEKAQGGGCLSECAFE